MLMPIPSYRSFSAPFTTDWKFASAASVSTANDHAFTNTANGYADDGSNVTTGSITWNNADATDLIKLSGFGFTTSDVPSGATILGIEVEAQVVVIGDYSLTLWVFPDGVSPVGQSQTVTDQTVTVTKGGAADLWSNTFADSYIRSASFGIGIRFFERVNSTPYTGETAFDYMKVRIYGE